MIHLIIKNNQGIKEHFDTSEIQSLGSNEPTALKIIFKAVGSLEP